MYKSFVFLISIFIFVFFLTVNCNQNPFFGVGNSVDIERPTVKVTSHSNGDYVKKSFTIAGECSDNIGIEKVTLTVKGSSNVFNTNLTKINESSYSFSIDLDADTVGEGDKTFEITARDTTGNEESTRIFLFIDTDLPEIVISEPLLLSKDEIDKYTENIPDRDDFKNISYFNNKTVKISGYIEDKFIIKQTTLKIYSENDDVTPIKTMNIIKDQPLEAGTAGDPLKWTFNVNSEELTKAQGKFKLKMTTFDMATNEGTVTEKTQTLNWIYVDQNMDIPRTVFTSIVDGDKINPKGVISGNSFDDDGLSAIYIKIVETGIEPGDYKTWKDESGDRFTSSVIKIKSGSNVPKLYTWSINAPTYPLSYKIYVITEDINSVKPENSKSLGFKVADQNDPVVKVTSHKDGVCIKEDSFTLSGEVFDNVEVTKLLIYYSGSDTTWDVSSSLTSNIKDISTGLFRKNWSKSFSISDVGGYTDKALVLYVCDNQNNYGMLRFMISGDSTSPTIKITSHNNNDFIGAGETLTLAGEVTDDIGVESLRIKYVEGNGDWSTNNTTDGISFTGERGKKNWRKIFTISGIAGYTDKTFEIYAKDIKGNETISRLSIKGDNQSPQITITQPSKDGLYVGQAFAISGEVFDNIDVKSVKIVLEGTAKVWELTDDKSSFSSTRVLDSLSNKYKRTFSRIFDINEVGGYGDKVFEIYAYDIQNNVGIARRSVVGDKNTPSVTVTSHTNNSFVGDDTTLTLSGEVTDNIGVVSVKIVWVEGNKEWDTTVSGNGIILNPATTDKKRSWTKTFNMSDIGGYTDKNFEIYAYDNSNYGVYRLSLKGDRAIPKVKITSHTNNAFISKTSALTLSGECTDDVEVVMVKVKYVEGGVEWLSTTSGSGLSLATVTKKDKTWSKTFNLSDIGGANTDKTFEIYAYDIYGNEGIGRIGLRVDREIPQVEILEPLEDEFVGETFTISGEVSDNIKVSKVSIFLSGTSKCWDLNMAPDLSDQVYDSSSNKWKRTFTKNFNISDVNGYGEKTFDVYAYDNENNYGVGKRRVTGDRNTPTVTITSHINGDYVKPNITLSGTCSDLRPTGITGVVSKVEIKIVETNTVYEATLDSGKTSWSKAFTSLTEGENNFEVTVYDDQNNKGYARLYMVVDNTPPDTVDVVSPTLKSDSANLDGLDETDLNALQYLQNGIINIKGTAEDNYKLKSVTLKLFKTGTDLAYSTQIIAG